MTSFIVQDCLREATKTKVLRSSGKHLSQLLLKRLNKHRRFQEEAQQDVATFGIR